MYHTIYQRKKDLGIPSIPLKFFNQNPCIYRKKSQSSRPEIPQKPAELQQFPIIISYIYQE